MIRKTSIVAAIVLGAASFTYAADHARTVYVGGHTAVTNFRTESNTPAQAPYALTGSERSGKQNTAQNIWVGNRLVGATVVQK